MNLVRYAVAGAQIAVAIILLGMLMVEGTALLADTTSQQQVGCQK